MWSQFDSIYCINLVTRDDRYEMCQSLFDELELKVEFFRTERHPNGGCEGCYRSHIECIKKAYENGDKNCLILEDDIVVNKNVNIQEMLAKSKKYMDDNPEWDLFYLGSCPSVNHYHRTVEENIRRGPCYHTHAYVINRPFMKQMLEYEYNKVPIDKFYIDLTVKGEAKSYHLYPPIFEQGDYGSDIETSGMYAEGNIRFDRLTSSYAYYVGRPWYLLLIIFIIIILIMVLVFLVLYKRKKTNRTMKVQVNEVLDGTVFKETFNL